ncbi:alpha/beta hydrolase family protein [Paenibacillus paridis]|uniref:alpha/beta hydrolase family protein n=1 Tax=Paenibacillus paridis TaxID=2583376 RepID=UPI00111FE668|nr:acetylxylan esterase [Paenibacillus paridis]
MPRIDSLFEDEASGIKAIFYDGVSYQGNKTRVFAYYGVPEAKGERLETPPFVPGIVLVHGGAGSAFAQWVKLWNDRGYAAIAMDLEGQIPFSSYGELNEERPRHIETHAVPTEFSTHPWSGPAKQGVFADYAEPPQEQWFYHAVAAVLSAHSILRSLPGVDPDQIGITGISWGGIITSLMAGLDKRLRFAMPIYGCGYLYEPGTFYGAGFAAMPPDHAEHIRRLWDPSSYLHHSQLPMLWLNGSQDTHFPLSIFMKSYELHEKNDANALLHSRISIQHGLPHSYSAAWSCPESYAFADSITGVGPPLIHLTKSEQCGESLQVSFKSQIKVVDAVLYWCEEASDWRRAHWDSAQAVLAQEGTNAEKGTATVNLPQGNCTFYMELANDKGWKTSTRLMKK